MIVSIDNADYRITCFRCGHDVESFNANDDLRCPDCKSAVSQAGIISAFEECVTYIAAQALKENGEGEIFAPAQLAKPPFMFTKQV